MPASTDPTLSALLYGATVEGDRLRCVFRCPASGALVESVVPLDGGQAVGDKKVDREARSPYGSPSGDPQRPPAVAALIERPAVAGRVRDAVVESLKDVLASAGSGGAQPAAIEMGLAGPAGLLVQRAFRQIAWRFCWDGKRWVLAAALPISAGDSAADLAGFARRLQGAPVTAPEDRAILGRVLIEIARADGRIADEERRFLAEHLGAELAGQADAQPPLSRAELLRTSPPVRETILMLAWALALVDRQLADSEREQLAAQALALSIPAERAAQLRHAATVFVVEQALLDAYPDGRSDPPAHAAALALAGTLGLSAATVASADNQARRRAGCPMLHSAK